MEYLLRTMFSDVPRRPHHHHHISPRGQAPTTPRGASTSADGAAEVMECEVVTCVPEKRALHVEVVLKRLHMPAAALAAAINLLNTDKLKVCCGGEGPQAARGGNHADLALLSVDICLDVHNYPGQSCSQGWP